MDKFCIREGNSGAVKQLKHVLVPPAVAQKHTMHFHLFDEEHKLDVDPLHARTDAEKADETFCIHDRDEFE